MKTLWWCGLAAALLVGTGLAGATDPRLEASLAPDGTLEISGVAPASGTTALQLFTPGLRHVELGRDTGEAGILYLPPESGPLDVTVTPTDGLTGVENVFFFNSLREADGWFLVLQFPAHATGTWKLNGRFSVLGGHVMPEIALAVRDLEYGENLLHLVGPALPTLSFRRVITPGEAFSTRLRVVPQDWTGVVQLQSAHHDGSSSVVERRQIAGPVDTWRTPAFPLGEGTDRAQLKAAAIAVGRQTLALRVSPADSLFADGFNLVYDLERKVPRMPHWLWAWGPTISLLLDLEKLDGVRGTPLGAEFRAAALAAGKRSLGFELNDPKHPAHGISRVRWEPSRATPNGWIEYLSTADSLFLAGWGWMRLHRETGEPVYLERTQRLVATAERLMNQHPVVPQDWVMERGRWTPHTLDESVFGLPGFLRLYEATKDPRIAALGRRYLDSHLEILGREGGLLARAWVHETKSDLWDPDIKGHAWVIEGYLDAYRLTGEARYLQLVRVLGRRVLECQAQNGGWGALFKRPGPNDPIDDKGTAIWAYFMYDVHRVTGDAAYLESARRALRWCLAQQVASANPLLDGALVNTNSMAYVRRRPITILYTNTFFALALLEELKLAPPEN